LRLTDLILPFSQPELLLQTSYPRVSQVCAVQKGQQIYHACHWHEEEIQLQHRLPLGLLVVRGPHLCVLVLWELEFAMNNGGLLFDRHLCPVLLALLVNQVGEGAESIFESSKTQSTIVHALKGFQ
jgi:hypothetical protein